MRRVVLDTNVLVASLLQPAGLCGRLLNLVVDGAAEVCVDDRILAEYAEVLSRRKLHLLPEKVQTLLEFFRQSGIPVIAHPLTGTLPDPDDLAFLEVAAAGEALLVTGNQRHSPKAVTGAVSSAPPNASTPFESMPDFIDSTNWSDEPKSRAGRPFESLLPQDKHR